MSGQEKFLSLVKQHGGIEVRWKNHRVFRFPSGVQVVVSKTSSDRRSWKNAYSVLRRALGLTPREPRMRKRGVCQVRHRVDRKLSRARICNSCNQSESFEELMKAQGVKPAKWR
jgi:hypothetical protein